jgi:hypothetical protein
MSMEKFTQGDAQMNSVARNSGILWSSYVISFSTLQKSMEGFDMGAACSVSVTRDRAPVLVPELPIIMCQQCQEADATTLTFLKFL